MMYFPHDHHLALLGFSVGTTLPDLGLGQMRTTLPDLIDGDPLSAPYRQTKASDTIPPDYAAPDFSIPPLTPGDLGAPNLAFMPEFTPDPMLPDLDAYAMPASVDVMNQQGIMPEPDYVGHVPDQAEIDAGLDMQPGLGFTQLNATHNATDDDPSVPDLQDPQLTPEPADTYPPIIDSEEQRPGQMASDAEAMLDESPDAAAVADKPYDTVYMDASGNNSRRTRHMDMLVQGLRGLLSEDEDNA